MSHSSDIERRIDRLGARLDGMIDKHAEHYRKAMEDIARLRNALRGIRHAIIQSIDEPEEAEEEEGQYGL